MKVRVFRSVSGLTEFDVAVNEGARVLNVLEKIHECEPDFAFRSCCRAGQCGSCAVRVNGEPVLACQVEAHEGDVIEPLNLTVIKDLVTDIAPVIAKLAFLVSGEECSLLRREDVSGIKGLRECIECFSCVSSCPAVEAAEYAGPTVLRQEERLRLDPRDAGDRIDEAVRLGLFSCTTCRKCVEVCPKHIDTPKKAIEQLRRAAALRGFSLEAHKNLAALIESTGRSVEKKGETFLELVPEVVEPAGVVRGTVGFFVGCMFNGRVVHPALDAVEVLRRNGFRVVIPKSQVCCGSPLLRTGLSGFVPELERRNIAAFEGCDVVLTMCAGCGSTLKNDYHTPFRVADITEFLCEAGFEVPAKVAGTYTYHDPCHLLRGQGVREQPRMILRECVDNFVDMPARCCGAGGGVKSGLPEEAADIGRVRAEMVKQTGADYIVTVCPFCEFHLHQVTELPVKNIASLMVEGYTKKDG